MKMVNFKINEPIFLMTGDADWASDDCLEFYVRRMKLAGIKPLIFGTNRSQVLEQRAEKGEIEFGIHPNFQVDSTQGKTATEIVSNLRELFPTAKISRCHRFLDIPEHNKLLSDMNYTYESNELKYLQKDIQTEIVDNDVVRLPVYWSDGMALIHVKNGVSLEADFEKNKGNIFTPGFKILNVHPFNYFANITSLDDYINKKHLTSIIKKTDLSDGFDLLAFGVQKYVESLIKIILQAGYRFHTFSEIQKLTQQDQNNI